MKITNMRLDNPNGRLLTRQEIAAVLGDLERAIYRAGFVSNVREISKSGVNIAVSGKTFKINPKFHGYNARVGYYDGRGVVVQKASETGYVKTDIPTWEQRVEFNHLINDVLDKHNVSADVRSTGNFIVRSRETGAVRDWKWGSNIAGNLILPLDEAQKIFSKDVLKSRIEGVGFRENHERRRPTYAQLDIVTIPYTPPFMTRESAS